MKFFLICLFLAFSGAAPVRAENLVTVFLYKADSTAEQGFREVYKWQMGETDEFRRFEYLAGKMKSGAQDKANPFVAKPDEMLVLSVKDRNGITGKDYYVAPGQIMITSIFAMSRYYEDKSDFYNFLKQEITNHSSLEKFPGEKIRPEASGIVVRYLINETLPNPAWLIATQKDVNLYDAFYRKLPEINGYQFQASNPFNEKGNFTLRLNYPKAPAKFVTVNKIGVRLSDTRSSDFFATDDRNYFKFFRDLTKDSMNASSQTEMMDRKKLDQGNF